MQYFLKNNDWFLKDGNLQGNTSKNVKSTI